MAFLHHLDGVPVSPGGCQWLSVVVVWQQWVGIMGGGGGG